MLLVGIDALDHARDVGCAGWGYLAGRGGTGAPAT
jgi:hypothetical protein